MLPLKYGADFDADTWTITSIDQLREFSARLLEVVLGSGNRASFRMVLHAPDPVYVGSVEQFEAMANLAVSEIIRVFLRVFSDTGAESEVVWERHGDGQLKGTRGYLNGVEKERAVAMCAQAQHIGDAVLGTPVVGP